MDVVDVKETREHVWTSSLHQELEGSVFSAGCSNWYINEFGRNSASFPGYARDFWLRTWTAARGLDDYDVAPARRFTWIFHFIARRLKVLLRNWRKYGIILAIIGWFAVRRRDLAAGIVMRATRDILNTSQAAFRSLIRW